MKRIFGYILVAVSLFASFAPLGVLAGPPPDGPTPPTEAEQIAAKKAECIANNPGQTAYCDCVANGGVQLNTDVPFIGRCINKDGAGTSGQSTTSTAFQDLIGGLSKMVVTAILIASFMMIIVGGVMRATGGPNVKKGKDMIVKVAIGLAILGMSGAILALINPNFFK